MEDKQNKVEVMYWEGKNIEEMSKEELIAALKRLGHEHQSSQEAYLRDMQLTQDLSAK